MALPYLDIQKTGEAENSVALAVSGELDLASAPMLEARLMQLRRQGQSVRLDLSNLTFIDSTGMRLLIHAVTDARQDGWNLEIAPELTEQVRRAMKLVHVEGLITGENGDTG